MALREAVCAGDHDRVRELLEHHGGRLDVEQREAGSGRTLGMIAVESGLSLTFLYLHSCETLYTR